MDEKFNIQVSDKHYFKGYDGLGRFITYWYQINETIKLKPKNILEIGIGNKTVTNYLKQFGYNVTSCDFDKNLNPDFTADVRKLPFKNNEFDLIICCEVLEHIPKKDQLKALKELKRVANKNLIISVPYNCASFEFFYRMNLSFFKFQLRVPIIIPYFFNKVDFKKNGQHYWELGAINMSKREYRKMINKFFNIKRELRPHYDLKKYFFILNKK